MRHLYLGILVVQWFLSEARDIKLAVFIPWSGKLSIGQRMAGVIPLAIEAINNNASILPQNNLTYVWKDTGSSPSVTLAAMADLWKEERPFVDAFIGPGFNSICKPAAQLSRQWGLPMISWGCSDAQFSNKEDYPLFSRIKTYGRTNPYNTSLAIAEVMRHFNWKTFALLYSSEPTWERLGVELKKVSKDLHLTMVDAMNQGFDPADSDLQKYKDLLNKVKEKTRVFILFCHMKNALKILKAAKHLGLTNGDYAFITLDLNFDMSVSSHMLDSYQRNRTLEGVLDISVNPADTRQYQELVAKIRQSMSTPGNLFYNNITEEVSHSAAYLYDAIKLYALALNDTITQGGNITDGHNITRNTFGKSFEGMTGKVSIDGNGDRIPSYKLRNVQNSSFVDIASISSDGLMFRNNVHIIWPGDGNTVPKDYIGECLEGNCPDENDKGVELIYIAIPVVILVVIFGIGLGVSLFKRSNRIRNVSSMIIKYEDLDLVGYVGRRSSGQFSYMSQEISARSERSSLFGIPAQRYAMVGRYQNRPVFVRKVLRRSVSLNEEIVRELYQVNQLTHININPYVGVCVVTPNICIISEACSRGSLADVLRNEDIKLDWTFKMSFATDISSGMEALHSSDIGFHGILASSNCLVDKMWVCKVADYGLRRFSRHTYQPDETAGVTLHSDRLWVAPEHLRAIDCQTTKPVGSQAGDVYSYAIILSEIVTRSEPHEMLRTTTTLQEIIRRIMSSEFPPLRPTIPSEACEPAVLKFIQQCWSEEPHARPSFREIRKSIRKINGGRSLRLVDSMLSKMEIYSNNLEALVEERTQQLEAEKAKTDQLLYEMLPRPVADQLKSGKSVEAESFDQVTVFFSDIVGFTQLSSSSTPIQVVTFLNDLYTYFDNIIPNYDVYKVETIGDAYMVVSGLPEKNRDRHAGEIATMALHLICDIRTFKIRHIPDTSPKLRVGIHTGPVVAGVVGIKKPRYDIFGDTVNVASRMESTGVPNRIHISLECRKALVNLGGYHTERRGEIELKGKGKVITYFLNGKDGFNRVRPGPL